MDKEQDKKQYEVSYLVKEEDGSKMVAKFVTDLGGTIEMEGPVNKIALAYPVKKETQGYFGFFHISLAPEEIKNLEHELETKPGVLRHLIITPPFKKMELRTRADGQAGRAPSKPVAAAPKAVSENKPSESLTNEELEKRIEEILK